MPVNDPVGDMLTRLRNASRARHDKVVIPPRKLKLEIARVLKERGFHRGLHRSRRQPQREITLHLKYGPDKSLVITGIKRISKPGLRRYVGAGDPPGPRWAGHQHSLHHQGHHHGRRCAEEEHRRRAELHGVLT